MTKCRLGKVVSLDVPGRLQGAVCGILVSMDDERGPTVESVAAELTDGWSVMPYVSSLSDSPLPHPSAVEEWPTTAGPADYALTNGGGVCGVVEAKKITVGPQGVLTQAERYSRGISSTPMIRGEFGVPFLYATNVGTGVRVRSA